MDGNEVAHVCSIRSPVLLSAGRTLRCLRPADGRAELRIRNSRLEINRDATVRTLLERSIALFGNLPQPHTLALWTAQGVELTTEDQTLQDAHVKDGDCLILRPSTVKGG